MQLRSWMKTRKSNSQACDKHRRMADGQIFIDVNLSKSESLNLWNCQWNKIQPSRFSLRVLGGSGWYCDNQLDNKNVFFRQETNGHTMMQVINDERLEPNSCKRNTMRIRSSPKKMESPTQLRKKLPGRRCFLQQHIQRNMCLFNCPKQNLNL